MLDIDILRGARCMFERLGNTAELEAECCADRLLNIGDVEGYRVWLQIVGAIRESRKRAPVSVEMSPRSWSGRLRHLMVKHVPSGGGVRDARMGRCCRASETSG